MKKTTLVSAIAFALACGTAASAEFNPQGVARGVISAGPVGATKLAISQVAPGKARFTLSSANAVYLSGDGQVTEGVKPHMTADDASGRGKAAVASVQANANAFTGSRL